MPCRRHGISHLIRGGLFACFAAAFEGPAEDSSCTGEASAVVTADDGVRHQAGDEGDKFGFAFEGVQGFF